MFPDSKIASEAAMDDLDAGRPLLPHADCDIDIAPGSSGDGSNDRIGPVGVRALLACGVLITVGAAVHVSAVALGGLTALLTFGLLLAVLLYVGSHPGWRVFHAGLLTTPASALVAFVSYSAGNSFIEWAFVVGIGMSGLVVALGARSGFQFTSGALSSRRV